MKTTDFTKRIGAVSIAMFVAALAVLAIMAFGLDPANAQLSSRGIASQNAPATENFNTLASSGTSSALPTGFSFIETGASADQLYTANRGNLTAGDTYSYGPNSDTDRALGGLRSGALIPVFGASFTNNTGAPLTTLNVSYTGEQWRLGTAGRADRLDFAYSTDATSLATGTYKDVNALDFSSPNITIAEQKNGNGNNNRTTVRHTIGGLNISDGATFFIRWSDFDAADSDDGLAVDDLSVGANRTPAANNDPTNPDDPAYAVNEDGGTLTVPKSAGVIANDTDPDNDDLKATLEQGATNGALSLANNGSFTYTPNGNYNGPDTFTYKAKDDEASSNPATATITVRPVNDAPSFTKGQDQSVDEDAVAQSVPGWATDISTGPPNESGQTRDFIVTVPEDERSLFAPGGLPAVSPEGELTYTPAENAFGTANASVSLKDGGGVDNGGDDESDAQPFTITINSDNDAPVAEDDGAQTPIALDEDGSKVIDVLENDTDVDDEASALGVAAESISDPAHGAASLITDGDDAGKVLYTPDGDYNGPDSFTYKVTDSEDESAEAATVSVSVAAVNDVPTAAGATAEMDENGSPVTIDLSEEVGDIETGDADLTYDFQGPGAQEGTLTPSSEGKPKFTFAPAQDFNTGGGTLDIAYTVTDRGDPDDCDPDNAPAQGCDAPETSASATLSIDVDPVNNAPTLSLEDDPGQSVAEDDGLQTVAGFASGAPGGGADEADQGITFEVANDNNPLFSTQPAIDPDGTLTYTLAADKNGVAEATVVSVDDGGTPNVAEDDAESEPQTFTITVAPENDTPEAEDGAATGGEDEEVTVDFTALVEDIETDDADLAYNPTGPAPEEGTLTATGAGVYNFTPARDFNTGGGTLDIAYAVTDRGDPDDCANTTPTPAQGCDDTETSDSKTFRITVNSANDAPTAVDDGSEEEPIALDEDGSKVIDVLANDTDPDSPASALGVVAASITTSANATATVITQEMVDAPDSGLIGTDVGKVLYKPKADFNGPDSFTYKATDGEDESAVAATVSVSVAAVNDPPTAAGDTKTATENTPLVFPASDLTGNDSAGPGEDGGQTLTVTAVGNPQNGTVVLDGGQITFTPQTGYRGPASFDYTVSDGQGASSTATATVSVTVVAFNDAPVAEEAEATVAEDGDNATFDLAELVADTETPDGDIEYAIATGPTPAQGAASIGSDGSILTFDPAPNFNTGDGSSPVVITYSATDDGDGDAAEKSDTGTLKVKVTPVNDPPTAASDSKTATSGQPLTFPAADLTANDSPGPADESGQALTVTAVGDPQDGGTVGLDGGQVTFTSAGGFTGPTSFTYTVRDPDGETATGTVNVTVEAAPLDGAPNAVNDAASTREDTAVSVNVLANDSDPEGDSLTVSIVSRPSNGSASVVNGRIRYTPRANYNGTDRLTYRVRDSDGNTDTATVAITVTPVNDAPVARSDSARTTVNTAVNINVLANDTDVDGDTLSAALVRGPGRGDLSRTSSGAYRYTPPRGFVGSTSFTYRASDGKGAADTATVTITVARR